jgi:hypothetical protein
VDGNYCEDAGYTGDSQKSHEERTCDSEYRSDADPGDRERFDLLPEVGVALVVRK